MEGPGGILPTPADLFTRLSDEVVLHILSFVPWPDVHARAALVCRRWWAITREPLPFHTPLREYKAARSIQAAWRAHAQRKLFIALAVTMKKRRRIIDELISTETFYIDSLVRALQAYAGKAKKSTAIKRLFELIALIIPLHQTMKERWQQRWVDNHQADVSVADCFQPLVMAQGRYCNYCLDYMAATQELMKKRHKFHHQPQPGQKPVLELAAYLVMPISRIPRYNLLLEELLKCTPPDHPEHDTLCKVRAQLRLMANGCNASIQQGRESAS